MISPENDTNTILKEINESLKMLAREPGAQGVRSTLIPNLNKIQSGIQELNISLKALNTNISELDKKNKA